jgi:hypothetical protein
MIKTRRIRWAWACSTNREEKIAYILVVELEGKRQLGTPRHR